MTNRVPRAQTLSARVGRARLALPKLLLAVVVVALSFGTMPERAGAAPGPGPPQLGSVERGLDLFVHVPASVPGGAVLPIDVQALGFPTAAEVAPLGGAALEATWDPESLIDPTKKDEPPATAPSPVRATADADGRATLLLPVPKGREKSLVLLVSVKTTDRERVREITVQRTAPEQLDLFVSDPRVVPGSEVVAWALWTSKDRSRPVANEPVEIVLTQGGVIRFRRTTKTDAAGAAMARVPIPRDDEPGAQWLLTARAASRPKFETDVLTQSVPLSAREEIPGRPTLWLAFDEGRVVAGGKARYRIRLRDASSEGIASHSVWVWSGPKGTQAPTDDDAFKKAAQRLVTDGAGEIVSEVVAPSTIALKGTEIHVEARTVIEGLPRTMQASIDVGQRRGYAHLTPEAGEIVPNIEQKLVVSLWGDDDKPIVGTFTAKGDGLDATFSTNEHGEAEVSWRAPKGIGAARSTGPCPGSVAAQVTLRAKDASSGAASSFGGALTDTSGMSLCVPVRRDSTALVRPDKLVVREGQSFSVTVVGAEKKAASLVLTQSSGARSVAQWVADAGQPHTLTVPKGATGTLTVHAAITNGNGPTEVVSTAILVLPAELPNVTGKISGGRAAPGGKVTLVAALTGEGGKPLQGSIAAVVIDKLGGGSFGPLGSMDTRKSLCREVGAHPDRCERALLGGVEMDPLRRENLRAQPPLEPRSDPAANAKSHMDDTFASVVRSLEGAVYEASRTPETLPDVRRKEKGKYVFNPELMTLVTDAMSTQPLTPGGEPVSLADLIAMDRQITYDNVARRIVRLKIFDVLSALRDARSGIDPDEPILAEPNVLLRKLVRDGSVGEPNLLDPWGGQLSFFKTPGEYIPFVSVRRGWELRSAGPDGKMGTGDDVKSPFERVLDSGSPYARAMDEDIVVDARYDMRVSDSTVSSWSETLLRATGTALGGEGGGGRGEGIGLGSISTSGRGSGSGHGSGRVSTSIAKGVAFVSAPVRTDAQGRVTIEIPLGDIETTWQVAIVGLPDAGRPAMSTLDVPVTVPLSSKVNAGATWTDGDRGEVALQVRNRSDADANVLLEIASRGAFVLAPKDAKKTVRVAKRGVATVRVPVTAKGSGAGYLDVRTSAIGLPEDVLTHRVEVRPNGELLRIARTTWVSDEHDLGPALNRPPFVSMGKAELIVTRGERAALESALVSLSPETSSNIDELAEIAAAASALRLHFVAIEGDGSKLAAQSREVGRTATAKLASLVAPSHMLSFSWLGRVAHAGFVERGESLAQIPECPTEKPAFSAPTYAAAFDAEPAPDGGGVRDCWTTFVAKGTNELMSAPAGALARAVLAFAKRPHRSSELKTLSKRLIDKTELDEEGNISTSVATTRADRALVYAALLVSSDPTKEPAKRARLLRWLLVQRDTRGSFGSAAATHGAIQAIVRESSYMAGPAGSITVHVDFGEAGEREIVLGPNQHASVGVPTTADEVTVRPEGGAGVMARVERTFLRPYAVAPQPGDSPAKLDIEWPSAPECTDDQRKKSACPKRLEQGHVGNMRVTVALAGERAGEQAGPSPVDVRIPLPPGVSLADATPGVRQLQGALHLRAEVAGEYVLTIPLRFSLAGRFTAREATAQLREYEADAAIARARAVTVAGR